MIDETTTAGGRVRLLAGPLRRALLAVAVAGLVAAGCGGAAPEVPLGADGQPDPVLELGRTVYGAQCSSCHGNEGQGGRGKPLNRGRALERYPEIEEMIAVVVEGKGSGMPSFEDRLEADEIEAVVRYVREVLN
ncbi:MAG: c-type cytochrome [Actinomycetota bacterium]